MFRQKVRTVQYMRAELKYKGARKLVTKPDLSRVLHKLQTVLSSEGILSTTHRSGNIHIGLREIIFTEDKATVLLLWGGGDKEALNPAFWNHVTNSARTEEAKKDEVVGYTCHMVFSLHKTPLESYIMLREQVPYLTNNLLLSSLNELTEKYATDILEKENKEEFSATPQFSVANLPSMTLQESLFDKKIKGVRAIKVTKKDSAFDENFSIDKENMLLRLKPYNALQNVALTLYDLVSKLRPRYDEIYIEYDNANLGSGSLPITLGEISDEELPSFLFERKVVLELGSKVDQFCIVHHRELTQRLCKLTIAEFNSQGKKHAETLSPTEANKLLKNKR